MLNYYTYQGVSLFEYGATDLPTSDNDFTLKLHKQTTVGALRRFISNELLEGVRYKDIRSKQLAVAIFAAFAHPTLQYVERNLSSPLWYELLCFNVLMREQLQSRAVLPARSVGP